MSEHSTEINLLDKVIGFFSPKHAYKRIMWRSGYMAADNRRRNEDWVPVDGNVEQINATSREIVRRKARDLERNSDLTNAIIGAFERNVVGSGFRLQADTGNEELNEQIEVLFKEWEKPKYCDICGRQSFLELCHMAVRRLQVDGGILFIKTNTGEKDIPFQLQAREVSDLDGDSLVSYQSTSKSIVGGVEVNTYGKPIAYHIKQVSPDGFSTIDTVRIDAKHVIALWPKRSPSQIREMSPLAITASRVADAEDYLETVSLKEKILACFSVFIKKANPSMGGPGRGLNQLKMDAKTGMLRRSITPGMIQELQPGDDAQAVVPNGQASNAKDMLNLYTRLTGAGQGLSYEAISRDMSQVNYSSARQGFLEDKRTYERMQRFLIDHFLDEVYEAFLVSAVTAGTLNIPDFWTNKKQYLNHHWNTPGWSWIDPVKETNANRIALESGQETLASIGAKTGADWKATMEQRAKELRLQKELEAKYEITFGKEV